MSPFRKRTRVELRAQFHITLIPSIRVEEYPLIKFIPADSLPINSSSEQISPVMSIIRGHHVSQAQISQLYGIGVNLLSQRFREVNAFEDWRRIMSEPLVNTNSLSYCYLPLSDEESRFEINTLEMSAMPSVGEMIRRELPHIIIKSFSLNLVALVDTGSEVTCVSESVFQQLQQETSILTLPLASTQLRGVWGKVVVVLVFKRGFHFKL